MQPPSLGLSLLSQQPIKLPYENKSKFYRKRPHATFGTVNDQTYLYFVNISSEDGLISPKNYVAMYQDKQTVLSFRDLLKNSTIETTNKFLENVNFVFAIDGNYDHSNPNLIDTTDDITEEHESILQNLINKCKKDGILFNIREDNKDYDVEEYEYCITTYLEKVAEIINIQNLTHLPKDVLNKISYLVTGEKGTIVQQLYKLKSKLPQKPFEKNLYVKDYEL